MQTYRIINFRGDLLLESLDINYPFSLNVIFLKRFPKNFILMKKLIKKLKTVIMINNRALNFNRKPVYTFLQKKIAETSESDFE